MQHRVTIPGDLILALGRINNFRDKACLKLQEHRNSSNSKFNKNINGEVLPSSKIAYACLMQFSKFVPGIVYCNKLGCFWVLE